MKRCLVCCAMLAFLMTTTQAIDYHPKAGPWTLDFSSSKNLSVKIVNNEKPDSSLWLVLLLDAAGGNGSTSLNLFSYNKSMSVDIYENAFLNAFLEDVTSPTKGPIFISGEEGIQGEGVSAESKDTLHVAVWPYRPYSDPESKA